MLFRNADVVHAAHSVVLFCMTCVQLDIWQRADPAFQKQKETENKKKEDKAETTNPEGSAKEPDFVEVNRAPVLTVWVCFSAQPWTTLRHKQERYRRWNLRRLLLLLNGRD